MAVEAVLVRSISNRPRRFFIQPLWTGLAFLASGWYLFGAAAGSVLFLSVAVHELGHLYAILRLGHPSRLTFVPMLGAGVKRLNTDEVTLTAWDDFWTSAAGLAGNLVLFAIGAVMWLLGSNAWIVAPLLMINGLLFAWNFIPMRPFDGGRMMWALHVSSDQLNNRRPLAWKLGIAFAVSGLAMNALVFQFAAEPSIVLMIMGLRCMFLAFPTNTPPPSVKPAKTFPVLMTRRQVRQLGLGMLLVGWVIFGVMLLIQPDFNDIVTGPLEILDKTLGR